MARHAFSGFTLIELLFGLVIFALILSIGLPRIGHYFVEKQLHQAMLSLQGHIKHARDAAAGTECDTEVRLKQHERQLQVSIVLKKTERSRGCSTWLEAAGQQQADTATIKQDSISVELLNSPVSIVFHGSSGALKNDKALELELRIKEQTSKLQLDGIGNGVVIHGK